MSATDVAQRERSSQTSEFMVGLLCGAAVGTVAGLLLATKPGTELRGEIADSAQRIRRRVGETYTHASDAVTEAVNRGREALHKGRESFDRARTEYDLSAPDNAMGATDNRF